MATTASHPRRSPACSLPHRGAGAVTVDYIPTDENTADIFTKVLKAQPFRKHRKTVTKGTSMR